MVIKLKPCKLLADSILLNATAPANEQTDNDDVIVNQDAKAGFYGWDESEDF